MKRERVGRKVLGHCFQENLLKKESLAVTEGELFEAVSKWTDSECARQSINIEEDKTARRRVLGDSVYEIFFLEISQENIGKYVCPTEILRDIAIADIFEKIDGLNEAGLKWKVAKKGNVRLWSASEDWPLEMSSKTKVRWDYTGESDALALTVNEAVLFHGVRLVGNTGGSQYEVNFTIKDQTVTGTYTSQEDEDGVPGYDVMLPEPISLLPEEDTTIITTIKGPNSYYGEKGKSSVKVNNIAATCKEAPSGLSGNSTSKTKGQFHEFFLSEL